MALNDDLDRQPIPTPIYSALLGARVVTLPPGLELLYVIGEFWVGTKTFRQLKAIGDLQERLRTAVVPLRRNLVAGHFQGRTRENVEGIVVEAIKAYAGRVPGMDGEVFFSPGVEDDDGPPTGRWRAVRVVRRVVIK